MKTSINTVFPKCNKGMRAITMAGVTRLERYWSVEPETSQEEGSALALQILSINLLGQEINYLNAQLRTSNDFT